MESKRFRLNKEDWKKSLNALLWNLGALVVGSIIIFLADIEFPMEWALLLPVINAFLVALKKFFENEGKLL